MKTKIEEIKEQAAREIERIAAEAQKKVAELAAESDTPSEWVPENHQVVYALYSDGSILDCTHYTGSATSNLLLRRGLIAQYTEAGHDLLRRRDEWREFWRDYMTAGDLLNSEWGACVELNTTVKEAKIYPKLISAVGARPFSSIEKAREWLAKYGSGDWQKGLERVGEIMKGGWPV